MQKTVIGNCYDLIHNGYQVIPITPFNNVPIVKGFTKMKSCYPLDEVDKWCEKYPDSSVALFCGFNDVYALDFDVDDEAVSKILLRMCDQLSAGRMYIRKVRTQNHHRFSFFFRADSELQKYGSGKSVVFNHNNIVNQIEMIGNRIITIYGVHRKTNKPYYWQRGFELWDSKPDDLAILSLDDVKKIFNVFERKMLTRQYQNATPDYKFRLRNNAKKDDNENKTIHDTFKDLKYTREYSDEEIDEFLSEVTGDTRDSWLEIGLALHDYYDGNLEGLRKWDEWSSQFNGYQGSDDCRKNWSSFHQGQGITMGTLVHKAKSNRAIKQLTNNKELPDSKEQITPLKHALQNYVYIATSNSVGDMSKPVSESIIPLQNFRNCFKNVKISFTVKLGKTGEEKTSKKPLPDVWLEHEYRHSAYSEAYLPINERLIDGSKLPDGVNETYYNLYQPPMVSYSDKNDLLHYFLEHIEYMFPSNPEWVINWMAQIVQQPYMRYRTILYSIATSTGTGRGWLCKLMGLLYGVSNVKTIRSMGEIIRDGAKNGYLKDSVLLIINETDAPGKSKYNVGDKLKTIVSDDKQEIDVKWGGHSHNHTIYTRVFMQSNSLSNLVIDRNDNRIQPFVNFSKPKSNDYYVMLYRLIEKQEFINQVWWYLNNYPIRVNDLQNAKMTDDKRMVIDANTSDTARVFYEFRSLVGKACFDDNMLDTYTNYNQMGVGVGAINNNELRYLMKENISFTKTIIINNERVAVHAFDVDDKREWSNLDFKRSLESVKILINKKL